MILDTINSVPTGTGRCQTRRRFPPSQGVTLLAPCPPREGGVPYGYLWGILSILHGGHQHHRPGLPDDEKQEVTAQPPS